MEKANWRLAIATIVIALACFLAVPVTASEGKVPNPTLSETFEQQSLEARALLGKPVDRKSYKTEQTYEQLRAGIAETRDRAKVAADRGSLDLQLVEARLSGLGPVPEGDASEPVAMAAQREALEAERARLMQPILRIRDIQYQADEFVRVLDRRIEEVERYRLLQAGGSLLDPRHWAEVFADLGSVVARSGQAFSEALMKAGPATLLTSLLLAVALALAGSLTVRMAWRKSKRWLDDRVMRSQTVSMRLGLLLLEDLAWAGVILLGVGITVAALGILLWHVSHRPTLVEICFAVGLAGVLLALVYWLGRSTLLSPVKELRLIRFETDPAETAFRTVRFIGLIVALEATLEVLENFALLSISTGHFLSSLLVLTGGLTVWRLAMLIQSAPREQADDPALSDGDDDGQGRPHIHVAKPFSRLLKLLAFAAVAAALLGYAVMAREIFINILLSIGTIALATYLHRTIVLVLDALASGALHRHRRILHLLPYGTGLLLVLAVLVLLAITWGYRPEHLSEAIVTLRTGVEFGETRISAGDFAIFLLVFLLGYAATRWLQSFLKLSILPELGMDRGVQAALVTGIGYIGILLAAVIAIASTGLDLSSLAFVAGALSVGIGFGLQSVVENFASGILLLIERPVKEGDWIEVGGHSGIVRKISVRSTQIETFDRHFIIIPNSELISGAVKNLSFDSSLARVIVTVGVSYGTDLERVRELLLTIAQDNPQVLDDPPPSVILEGFGESSVDFSLRCFLGDVTVGSGVRSELRFEIAQRFGKEGIEMPFPQRDIHIRTGLAGDPLAPSRG